MSLKQRLTAYFKRHKGQWIASGEIQRLVTTKTTYSAANATRRLRELENEGILEVKHVKNHSHYRYKEPKEAFSHSDWY